MYKGKKLHKSLLSAGILVLVMGAILVTGCTSGSVPQGNDVPEISTSLESNSPTNSLVQNNNGGAVTVDVKWLGEQRDNLLLEVSMNTHSVNLDTYDLRELAQLRDDNGKEYLPASWDSQSGGHHRRGILTFQIPDSPGAGPKYLELIIRDVAGIKERVFRWELGVS